MTSFNLLIRLGFEFVNYVEAFGESEYQLKVQDSENFLQLIREHVPSIDLRSYD